MNSLQLKLGKVEAKYFRYHHNSLAGKHEISPLFRELILMLVEPSYDKEKKRYREELYDENFTESIKINVCEIDNTIGLFHQHVVHIPAYKMILLNRMIRKFLFHEIHLRVNAFMEAGKQVREAILSVYDEYDIEESELNYDSVLKANIRYRQKHGCQLKK